MTAPHSAAPGRSPGTTLPILVLAVMLVAAAVAVVVLAASAPSRISAVARDFAVAVAIGDEPEARRLLCTEEAEALDDETVARDDAGPGSDTELEPWTQPRVSALDVTGDTASAIVTLPGRDPLVLDLRREDGWRVCASDGNDP